MIKNAQFLISVATSDKILVNQVPEIAVAGKSNVGKSSFINFITGNGKLARTSKDPGRTRLLNYFACNNEQFILVDLPGYGFAKVSATEKAKWGELIESYLDKSKTLSNVFMLVDIRHDPTVDDVLMLNFLNHYNIPFTIIATKADKLGKNTRQKRKAEIASFLRVGKDNIYMVSSNERLGKEEIDAKIQHILDNYSLLSTETSDVEIEDIDNNK